MTLQQLRYVIAIQEEGSFSRAAKALFVSQPSVSALVKDLEDELAISIFSRGPKGIVLTQEGKELLRYAYQMIDQEGYIKEHFRRQKKRPPIRFSVSSQHYSFVVELFTKLENSLDAAEYVLRLKETLTSTVISDVARQRSEIGIIFRSEATEQNIERILRENKLAFTPLVATTPHIFVRRKHPLAGKKTVSVEDLRPYPCIVYDQNDDIPLYYSEEISLADYKPPKTIYVSDMFSCVFMMENCDAYNIGTGLFPEHRASTAYTAIPLCDRTPIIVGWIGLANTALSPLGRQFIDMLASYLAGGHKDPASPPT